MDFNLLLNRDITVHTTGHKFRGVLLDIITTKRQGMDGSPVLAFKMGVDDFYIKSEEVFAVTVHGREFGKELLEESREGQC